MEIMTNQLRANEVRLVGEDGEQLGIVSRNDAVAKAKDAQKDLVIVSDKATPPVVRIMDFKKFQYEQKKKEREQKKKQRQNQIKIHEIQLRPVTDKGDLVTKARKIKEFIESGDKVKIKVKFRGREMSHKDQGFEIIESLIKATEIETAFEMKPNMAGRDMIAIITPPKAKSK